MVRLVSWLPRKLKPSNSHVIYVTKLVFVQTTLLLTKQCHLNIIVYKNEEMVNNIMLVNNIMQTSCFLFI